MAAWSTQRNEVNSSEHGCKLPKIICSISALTKIYNNMFSLNMFKCLGLHQVRRKQSNEYIRDNPEIDWMSVLTFPEGDNSFNDLWSCHLRKNLIYFLLDPLKIRCHTVKSYHNPQNDNTHMLTVFTIQITGICSTLYYDKISLIYCKRLHVIL